MMWKPAARLSLGLAGAGLLAACGSSSLLPPADAGAGSEDAVAAAARTQKEFERYWAGRRGESVAQPVEQAPEPAPAQAAASEPSSSRQTFSEWWAAKKQEKAEAPTEQVAEAAPAPQQTEAPQEKKNWSPSQWFGGGNKEKAQAAAEPEPEVASRDSEDDRPTFSEWWAKRKQEKNQGGEPEAEPAAQASNEEPTKKNTLPIVTWWENRKKGGEETDVSNIDLSGNFPTATRVKDWDGYVHSPYNNRFVDVKGVPSGTIVADPRYDLSERKFFIVP